MILMESRTFKYPGGHCCLQPVADMFNNNSNANIESWAFEQQPDGSTDFVAKATSDIKRGEEILLQYGRKGFVKYFFLYGFMPDEAVEDSIGFTATFKDSPEEKWKIGFSAGQHRFFRSISGSLEHSSEFFELVRWVVYKEEDDVE